MNLLDIEISNSDCRWKSWLDQPPPPNWLHLEIWRREWPGPKIVSQAQVPSWMNVNGLYWRRV